MNSNEVRKTYLQYLKEKGHTIVPSVSLLPDDYTVLFTIAGMQPMMPYLLGEKHEGGTRVADSQQCFRSTDIEEVGDNRHTTFFEMLGNWSFGDYYKNEQLSWMFDLLVNKIGINPKNIYVTVFGGNEQIGRDERSVEIWKGLFKSVGIDAKDVEHAEKDGMQDGRIFYYDEEKNWWSRSGKPEHMPAGEPGGPDSEMFYDFGGIGQHDEAKFGKVCHVNCDCGRFIEIGNNVFMEYQKQEDGSFKPLPSKNVDFGGGLERITAASQNQSDIFMTDSFAPIIKRIEQIVEAKEGLNDYKSIPRVYRIMADHLKAATMLIAAGVEPSNKAQGYYLRRLIRRAVRFLRIYPFTYMLPFAPQVAEVVIEMYTKQYPDLLGKKAMILEQLDKEEKKFTATLAQGLKEVNKNPILDGEIAFRLYESFGFPFELTEEIAREKGQNVEYGEFRKAFEKHQEISRAGAEKKFGGHGLLLDTGELKAGNEEELKVVTRLHTATHLMQQALRHLLGDSVHQMGSDITPERTRFDFNCDHKLTPEEIRTVEDEVNDVIKKDMPMQKVELPIEEAKKTGALYFFKEKYPEKVSVYYVGDTIVDAYSKEFCGGPHVTHTGEIGTFKIAKEESSGSGVRRIRASVG
ncbi:MAG: alanine--tRNA ligase [bacterium]|nr:alanine--tRNA ligase [bacterium]